MVDLAILLFAALLIALVVRLLVHGAYVRRGGSAFEPVAVLLALLAVAVLACGKSDAGKPASSPANSDVAQTQAPAQEAAAPAKAEVAPGTQQDLLALAASALGKEANWLRHPAKIVAVELADAESRATVQFRLANATSPDLIRQMAILEFQRMAQAFYGSPKFAHVDRLDVVGIWRFGSGADATEEKLISAQMTRAWAKQVPWSTISIGDFEQLLTKDAALWKHAQFPSS